MKPWLNKKNVTKLAILLALSVTLLSAGCTQAEPAETTIPVTETTIPATQTETQEETAATKEVTKATAPAESTETTAASEPQWIFESTDMDGNPVSHSFLADYKVTLVNVWATNCPNCIAEMPDLEKVSKEYADKGVGFLGIVSDIYENEPDEILHSIAGDILADAGVEFTNVLASDTIIASILAGIYAVPTTFFADSEGRIIGELVVGAMSPEQMRDNIEIALAETE